MRGPETSGAGQAGRGPICWVAVPDARGRLRMEMRWSVPGREVIPDVAEVAAVASAETAVTALQGAPVPSGSHAA